MALEEEPELGPDSDDDLEMFIQDTADLAAIFGGPEGPASITEVKDVDDTDENRPDPFEY